MVTARCWRAGSVMARSSQMAPALQAKGARRDQLPGRETGSEQPEQESQGKVDLDHLVGGKPTDHAPEPQLDIDGSHLVDEHFGRRTAQVDVRSEDRWCSPGRGGGDDHRRQEDGALKLDGVSHALLLVTPGVLGCAQTIDVTTHGSRPSPGRWLPARPGLRDRCAGARRPQRRRRRAVSYTHLTLPTILRV